MTVSPIKLDCFGIRSFINPVISKLGNPGWDWNGLLPYFKKPEKYRLAISLRRLPINRSNSFTPPDPAFARKWNLTFDRSTRGSDGPIKTFFPRYIPDAELPIEPAASGLGIEILNEPVRNHSYRIQG